MFSQDYEELFKTLNAYRIKYLVIGAHAVMFYSQPRFTKDLDVWVPSALNDPERVYAALKAFGAPLTGMSPRNFQDPNMVLQIGVAPVRVDILIDLPPVSAQKAWENREKSRYGKATINIIGLKELVELKKVSNRSQDKIDIERLNRSRKQKG